MGYIRTRANGQLAFVFSWKGKKHTDEQAAEQVRQDANEQLERIRKGESALASKLLSDGHSIMDVLFGSEEIGHLIASPTDDNPLTISQLKEAFIDHLKATGRTPGHVEGTRVHLDHFIRVLGDVRVRSLTDADMTAFQNKREKEKASRKKAGKKKVAKKKSRKHEKPVSKRLLSQGTIRSDFKSFRSAVNWAMTRKPPLLAECPFTIPKITSTTPKPFLPAEEIKRLIGPTGEEEQDELLARWLLDLKEINSLIEMTAKKMPEMLLPMQLVCSTGMRRVQLVRLRPSDYVKGRLTITSKKGARQKGLSEISLTIELRDSVAKAVREHVRRLPKPDITRLSEIDLESLGKKFRLQKVIFETARDLFDQMNKGWKDNKECPLAQLFGLVEQVIESDRIVIRPALFNQDDVRRRIILTLSMTKVVQHIGDAIHFENTESLEPVFDSEHPIRCTGDMRLWYTGKPCEVTKRSHISHCVYDSTWEASESFELERNKKLVAAWVKNDHLGYEIMYVYKGIVKKYRPDFLIRLTSGTMLVLEVKGQDTQKDRTKRAFLDEWVRAVNQRGGFGRWAWDVSFDAADIVEILVRHDRRS